MTVNGYEIIFALRVKFLIRWLIQVSLPPANEVWGKVMFWVACVKVSVQVGGTCVAGGHAWQGGREWSGACMAGGHAWQGGMHGGDGMHGGGRVWQGACMVGDRPPQALRQRYTVNERAVRILLECILVFELTLNCFVWDIFGVVF